MFNKKEIIAILVVTLVLGFSLSLMKSNEMFLDASLMIFGVLMVNILGKKIIAYHLDSKIEVKIWEVKQYFWTKHAHFEKPFPFGLVIPLISSALTAGYFVWLACLTFDVKPEIYRAAKRYGLYSFSEVTEWHEGLIAAAGIGANLLIAIISYLMGYPVFASLNIWLAFFSIIPISDLDGNKIFFGSLPLWNFLAAVTLIAVGYSLLLI